jgi:hypothetical protein
VKIQPPEKNATEEVISKAWISHKFSASTSTKAYLFDGVQFKEIASLTGIKRNSFYAIEYDIMQIEKETIIVLAPATKELNYYQWTYNGNSNSSLIHEGERFAVYKTIYDVNGYPPTATEFNIGPNS